MVLILAGVGGVFAQQTYQFCPAAGFRRLAYEYKLGTEIVQHNWIHVNSLSYLAIMGDNCKDKSTFWKDSPHSKLITWIWQFVYSTVKPEIFVSP